MLVYHRKTGQIAEHRFYEIVELLRPDDLLVFNDSSVLPAKLILQRSTGWRTNGLFVKEREPGQWEMLIKSRGRCKAGERFSVITPAGNSEGTVELLAKDTSGHWLVKITPVLPPAIYLDQRGHMPLPPYIEQARKKSGAHVETAEDRREYQTVYAREPGSLAAPTAGLHFTQNVLDALAARGVSRAEITLHIGLGTFVPVTAPRITDHHMHEESFTIQPDTARRLRDQHRAGRRIIAVGTTSVRAMEAAADHILAGDLTKPISMRTNLLIAPGYAFKLCTDLLTNFHLPRTTLLALVAAKIGLPALHTCYEYAVAHRYRFFSYGDAMLIVD
jgi:S-adenosylmethionine:tRNA ribosyltransferase-isomerase